MDHVGRSMPKGSREQRIEQMLSRLRDAMYPEFGGIGRCQPMSVRLEFPPSFNDALRELDRCLSKMRQLGNQQAIDGIPLRVVHWHVRAWFVDVQQRQVPVYVRQLVRSPGPGPKTVWARRLSGYRLEPLRHRDASEHKASLGVPWLAREFRWEAIHLREVLEACGEVALKEAA